MPINTLPSFCNSAERVAHGQSALTRRPNQGQLSPEGDQGCRWVGGAVGVAEYAPNGGLVANTHVVDGREGFGQDRPARLHQRRSFDLAVSDQRPEAERAGLVHLNVVQARHAAQADEGLRHQQPLAHDQRHPGAARHQPGVLAEVRCHLEGLVNAVGSSHSISSMVG